MGASPVCRQRLRREDCGDQCLEPRHFFPLGPGPADDRLAAAGCGCLGALFLNCHSVLRPGAGRVCGSSAPRRAEERERTLAARGRFCSRGRALAGIGELGLGRLGRPWGCTVCTSSTPASLGSLGTCCAGGARVTGLSQRPCTLRLGRTSLRDVSQPLDGGIRCVPCDLAGRGPSQLAPGFLRTSLHAPVPWADFALCPFAVKHVSHK